MIPTVLHSGAPGQGSLHPRARSVVILALDVGWMSGYIVIHRYSNSSFALHGVVRQNHALHSLYLQQLAYLESCLQNANIQ